jgi:hypothetical protein
LDPAPLLSTEALVRIRTGEPVVPERPNRPAPRSTPRSRRRFPGQSLHVAAQRGVAATAAASWYPRRERVPRTGPGVARPVARSGLSSLAAESRTLALTHVEYPAAPNSGHQRATPGPSPSIVTGRFSDTLRCVPARTRSRSACRAGLRRTSRMRWRSRSRHRWRPGPRWTSGVGAGRSRFASTTPTSEWSRSGGTAGDTARSLGCERTCGTATPRISASASWTDSAARGRRAGRAGAVGAAGAIAAAGMLCWPDAFRLGALLTLLWASRLRSAAGAFGWQGARRVKTPGETSHRRGTRPASLLAPAAPFRQFSLARATAPLPGAGAGGRSRSEEQGAPSEVEASRVSLLFARVRPRTATPGANSRFVDPQKRQERPFWPSNPGRRRYGCPALRCVHAG